MDPKPEAQPDARPDPKQKTFGRFRLVERLAVGGMAEIYRAQREGDVGEVAIKRIRRELSADPTFVRMFADEARVAAQLSHPNIVRVVECDRAAGEGGEQCYIAMELVEGKDLRHLFKEALRTGAPLNIAQSVHVAVEVLRGLHYAHTRADGGRPLNLVHRDVTPHNILISYAGEVKLADFGIAKATARATSSGLLPGKLRYMSPEQAKGQPIDRRSDLFSLGVVLWELLALQRLYGEPETDALIARVQQGRVPLLSTVNPAVPRELEAIVARLTSTEPAARFGSANEVVRALTALSAYSAQAESIGEKVKALFPEGLKRATLLPESRTLPDGNKAEQRTMLASELPAEVQAVLGKAAPPPAAPSLAKVAPRARPDAPTGAGPAPAGGFASAGPPPAAPPAPAGSIAAQKTRLAEARPEPAPKRQLVVPTVMRDRPTGKLPPLRAPRAWGRWVAGPLLACIVAAATAALAGRVLPSGHEPPPLKKQGRVHVLSEPPGATVTVDGQPYPHFTPTTIEAEIGATVKVGLQLDGYAPRELDVFVDEGERSASARLTRLALPPPPAPALAPPREHHARPAPAPAPAGTATVSIFVRPWAIVYVDGARLRQTPIEALELSAGKHSLELVNDVRRQHEKVTLELKAGEAQEIRRDWDH